MTLQGKVSVVTGASRGIGAAIAKRLARDGAAIVASANETRVGQTAAAINAASGRAIAVEADVTSAADVARLYDAAEAAFGRVDISVQNAGVITIARIEAMTEAEWDRVMRSTPRASSCAAAKRSRASAGMARAAA